jgi:ferritin-like metal-binding protein YciE
MNASARAGIWNAPACSAVDDGSSSGGKRRLRYRAASAQTAAPASDLGKKEHAMGIFSKDIKTMDDLFLHALQDIYYAENKLLKALPDMAKKATDPQLKEAFKAHLAETKRQVERLEDVFRMQDANVKGIDCPAIDGIVEEAEEIVSEVADKSVLDAALIAAAQAAEHYEITRYGTLIAWAKLLGRNDVASMLQKTIEEEKSADKKLTALAEKTINRKAA